MTELADDLDADVESVDGRGRIGRRSRRSRRRSVSVVAADHRGHRC